MNIILSLASLCVIVLATPNEVAKRQDPEVVSSVFSRISSLGNDLLPPASLVPQLTGIPESVKSALYNTALQSSLASEFQSNGPPAWFTSLSPDAKAYILAVPGKESSVLSQIVSIEVAAGFTTLLLPPAPAAVTATTTDSEPSASANTKAVSASSSILSIASTTQISKSTITSASLTSADSAKSSSKDASAKVSPTSGSSKTSTAGAAQITGVFAAVVIGAIGMLGLAMAL